MNKKLLLAVFLISIVFVFGCARGGGPSPNLQGQAVGSSQTGQGHTGSGTVGANQGNLAPDFTVTTTEGKTIRLSDLTNDKPTVVYFFATWCPNCARDLAAVKEVYPQYADKINFIAVDIDSRESSSQIAEYKQRMGLSNIDFAPSDRKILSDYNVVYTTTKFFIGKGGNILNKGVGGIDQNTWKQAFQSMAQ